MIVPRSVLAFLIILLCTQNISAQDLYKGKPVVKIDWNGPSSDCVSGEIIVKLKPSFDKSVMEAELSALGLTLAEEPGRRRYVLKNRFISQLICSTSACIPGIQGAVRILTPSLRSGIRKPSPPPGGVG